MTNLYAELDALMAEILKDHLSAATYSFDIDELKEGQPVLTIEYDRPEPDGLLFNIPVQDLFVYPVARCRDLRDDINGGFLSENDVQIEAWNELSDVLINGANAIKKALKKSPPGGQQG